MWFLIDHGIKLRSNLNQLMLAPHITDWSMPPGDSSEWDLEQETYAYFLARSFAKEYMYDFSASRTAVRLGCPEKYSYHVGSKIANHPLTQKYVREMVDVFASSNRITKDNILALLWKEANDEIRGSSSSRVAAAEKLAKITGVMPDNINVNMKVEDRSYVDKPVTPEEFKTMKEMFDGEY